MTTIELKISGFYINDGFPSEKHKHPGIYFIYLGYISGETKCTLDRLLYIGESENIYERFSNHAKYEEMLKKLVKSNKHLFLSFAIVKNKDLRETAEKALIYWHKPPWNDKSKDTFEGKSKTKIILSGKTNLLNTFFIVDPIKKE
jgi:excinuclease UvrABC nuclease subunit